MRHEPEEEREEVPPGAGRLPLRLVLEADFHAVRRALVEALAAIAHLPLTEEERGTLEIVLAEALNNVVEHAPGACEIEVRIRCAGRTLRCTIIDDGAPAQADPWAHVARPCLREPSDGGFGCFLISALAREVRYASHEGRNHLSFRIGTEAGAAMH